MSVSLCIMVYSFVPVLYIWSLIFFVIGITKSLHHQTFTTRVNDVSRPPVVGNRRSSGTKRRRVSNEGVLKCVSMYL